MTADDWLRHVIEIVCEGLDFAEAQQWRRRIDAELLRSTGTKTLSVVHDWHSHSLGPMLIEASARWAESAQAQEALRTLHTRASAGEPIAETEWAGALEPALRQIYRHAYPYAQAYTAASADASSYATAHGYAEAEATRFGDSYAEMHTDANARVYAEANAAANAMATAARSRPVMCTPTPRPTRSPGSVPSSWPAPETTRHDCRPCGTGWVPGCPTASRARTVTDRLTRIRRQPFSGPPLIATRWP